MRHNLILSALFVALLVGCGQPKATVKKSDAKTAAELKKSLNKPATNDAEKTPKKKPPKRQPGPAIGTDAPEIVGVDLDGKEFALSEYEGKVVVLDFWGDW